MSRNGWTKKKANANDDNGWAERGGYMAAKVSKLDEQFKLDAPREKQKEGTCSSIFSGVAIYVNGYTDPSADELRRLMMLHGGQFHMYYSRSKTTHIIANNLPNCKIQELKGEKVIRPDWITDSVKAGRLLPYIQYQLYAKQNGPLFPGLILRQTSDIAGPSHGTLQTNAHHKPHLPQHNVEQAFPNQKQSSSSYENTPNPNPNPSNSQPQSIQHSCAPHFSNQPSHSASIHLSVAPRHRSPSQTRAVCNPSRTKSPQSTVQTPHRSLQHQKTGQQQPQTYSSCSTHHSGCREAELKLNGLLQTSSDVSHSKMNEMHECGREDAFPQVVTNPPLTNGHPHLLNGALNPQDLSFASDDLFVDKDLSECTVKSLTDSHDPYEFPNSPPKQCCQADNEQRPKPPHSYEVALKVGEAQLLQKQPLSSLQIDSNSEKSPISPASHSTSHCPIRLNGSHYNAFSCEPASLHTTNTAHKPDAPTDKSSSSSKAAHLLVQTGDLISEYYSHSRLHQISTWRTGFSEYVNELHSKRQAAGDAYFPGKDRLRKYAALHATDSQGTSASVKSCILHVDMDCFFVSVGIRHRPDLKGKPVAVTSNRGQGRVPLRPGANPQLEQQYYTRKHVNPQHDRNDDELHITPSQESPESHAKAVDQDAAALSMAEIASCSYEARRAGVRNGMFFGKAKQLCPSLQSVPYDFEAYKEVALTMYEILAGYTHDIEALSCDEVLIDGSTLLAELGISPDDLAKTIRAEIKEKTGCCASVGMGSNILLARLATRKAKPDGHYFLKSEEVDDFIRDLPVTNLPGVGPVMGRKLGSMGVSSCGDLRQVSLSQLQKKFGPRTGQTLFRFCRGLDDRPVRYEKERKSVSAEMNYNIRFTRIDEAESFLTNLSMEVQRRLQEAGLRGRRVTLKVMVRKVGAPLEPAKYGGHGICDSLARTVMLAHSTDSGQLIAAAVIKLFHAMKLQVQDLRGVGIQVQLLEGHHSIPKDSTVHRSRSIKEMLLNKGPSTSSLNREGADNTMHQAKTSSTTASSPGSFLHPASPEPVPGTSKDQLACRQTPKRSRTRLNLSIEVPSPSQVDRSVLEALPAELREQVEQSWTHRVGRPNSHRSQSPQPLDPLPQASSQRSCPTSPFGPPASGPPLHRPVALVLQIQNQPDSPGIVLELPNFSQVDPDVFAALPKELQEELKSAYNHATTVQPQTKALEQKNPLLQLKQPGVGLGRVKRRYKKKNTVSPVKKGLSPLKRSHATNSAANTLPLVKPVEHMNTVKSENVPTTSSSKPDIPELASIFPPRPAPALAGASDLTDIKTLLREWVTTISEPMEEDILHVVKYCTELIEDKDLEKLDLIIKYMKRLMQQSVESVWSMAFDFIVDNVQVVVQQAYGSTLKIA